MQQLDISSKSALLAPRFANTEFVAQVMSSREIAELVGSRHDNVKRTIETMAVSGIVHPHSEDEWSADAIGRPRATRIYRVNKRDSFVVVAQLCPEFTAALVDRWQELESQVSAPALPSYAEALRGLADQIEQTEHANALLAIAAPKAAFVDQYVEASGSMSFRQVCKLICANERAFRQMLLDKGAMYYLGGVLTPRSDHHHAGRFVVKTGTSEHNGHAFSQARFTAKGVQWVAGLWAARQLEVAA
jgi:phage antirepressor YoqD-like protein